MEATGEAPDESPGTAAALETAKSAWPELVVDDAAFTATLEARIVTEGVDALKAVHVADLYLAFACAAGNAVALSTLERELMPGVRAMLLRLGYSAAQTDDALQSLREDLFVATPDRAPGVLHFTGEGPLKSWLRVVAGRIAARMHRRHARTPLLAQSTNELVDLARDPELELMARTYGAAMGEAMQEGLRRLDVRDRLLLKQRFRHRLGVEELGSLHGVNASTISRWVARVRGQLVEHTRSVMMKNLGLTASEMQSVLRLIESRIEMTLSTTDERER